MTLCQDKKLTRCQNDLPEQNLENVAVFLDNAALFPDITSKCAKIILDTFYFLWETVQ